MKKYRLGDIFDIQIGKTPSRANDKYWDGNNLWVSIRDLNDLEEDKFIVSTKEAITDLAILESGIKPVPPNTLLYSFKLSVGKVAITKDFIYTNEAIAAFIPKEEIVINIDYLFFLLKSKNVDNILHDAAKGKSLNKQKLNNLEVELPSIDIQNKVALKLNTIYYLISRRERSIKLLDEYIKSTFLEMFGDPVSNPLKLKKQKLGMLSSWQSGGTPLKSDKSYYEDATINWFTSGELNSVFISQSKEKVNIKAIENSKTKNVKKGSLLIGMYDTAALKSSIVTVDCCCNQAIAFSNIDPNKGNTIFIYYNIVLSRDYILNQRKGARQKNLNLSQIKNIDIITPSIKNQNLFADQFCIIEEQKQRAIQSATLLQELFQSLQYSLFNKTEDKDVDEIDLFITDELKVENLLESLKNDKEKSLQQYELEKDILFKILERTEQRNKEDKNFLKGVVLKLDNDKIAVKTNKDDKFGL